MKGLWVFAKMGGSDFSHKKGGAGKIWGGGGYFKKEEYHLFSY